MELQGPRVRWLVTTPANRGQRPKAGVPGRRCAHAACSTVLSRYNPDAYCTVHGGWRDDAPAPRLSGKARSTPQATTA